MLSSRGPGASPLEASAGLKFPLLLMNVVMLTLAGDDRKSGYVLGDMVMGYVSTAAP